MEMHTPLVLTQMLICLAYSAMQDKPTSIILMDTEKGQTMSELSIRRQQKNWNLQVLVVPSRPHLCSHCLRMRRAAER